MTQQVALHLASGAMITTAKIAAPILLSTMVVGLVVSLFQSVTQIQEMTLTFVPKLLVVGLVIGIAGHWMLGQFTAYVHQLFSELPQLLSSGVGATAVQIDISAPWLIAFLLVLARALAWLMVVSPFSNRSVIPTTATVGVAAGMAMMVAPRLEHSAMPTDTVGLVSALVLQVATGVALGFVVQLLLTAATLAGGLLDQVGGLTIPPSMNPLSHSETPLMGQFYQQVVVLLLFATNGYLLMVDGFVRSFDGPGFSLQSAGRVASVVVTDLGVFFVSAIEIAAPVMVVLFGAQIVLALVSKAAPQANVWLLGFPLQVFLVLVLVALTVSLVPGYVTELLTRGLGDGAHMFGVI